MSKWNEYQDFSTNAKPYGGANAYLDFLENNAREEGREVGRTEGGIAGVLITLGTGAVIAGGVWVFGKVKKYYLKRKQKNNLCLLSGKNF